MSIFWVYLYPVSDFSLFPLSPFFHFLPSDFLFFSLLPVLSRPHPPPPPPPLLSSSQPFPPVLVKYNQENVPVPVPPHPKRILHNIYPWSKGKMYPYYRDDTQSLPGGDLDSNQVIIILETLLQYRFYLSWFMGFFYFFNSSDIYGYYLIFKLIFISLLFY